MLREKDFPTDEAKRTFRENFGIWYGDGKKPKPKTSKEQPINTNNVSQIQSVTVEQEPKKPYAKEPVGETSKVKSPVDPFSINDQTIDRVVEDRVPVEVNVPSKPKLTRTIDQVITPYSFTSYLLMHKIEDEEAIASLIPIYLNDCGNIALFGDSGTGKSMVADWILKLFSDQVGETKLTSKKAIWRKAHKLDHKRILYFPEAQHAGDDGIQMMKFLGEGKDAEYEATNSRRTDVDVFKFTKGKSIITTLADEDKYKFDPQLHRRFMVLYTTNTTEHIQKCIEKAFAEFTTIDVSTKEMEIVEHISDRLEYMKSLENTYVINPFMGYMVKAIPPTSKAQAYKEHYKRLLQAWGKFYSPQRNTFEVGENKFVLLNLEDVYNIVNMYHKYFRYSLECFAKKDETVPEFEPDWNEALRSGFYTAENEITITTDEGTINLGQEYPDLIDKWKNDQLMGSTVYTVDYKTGENIAIADLSVTQDNDMNVKKAILADDPCLPVRVQVRRVEDNRPSLVTYQRPKLLPP